MDLILWRSAEAVDLDLVGDDMERHLTHRGEKHAARMAAWLDRQLPDVARVYSSPARRAVQTAQSIARKHKVVGPLSPLGTHLDLLTLAGWPDGRGCIVLVGHQPAMGRAIASILGLHESECAVRKGALWWLRCRERDGQRQNVVVTVQSPDYL